MAPTLQPILVAQWEEIGQKIIQLASEFPEDRYSFKATDQVRSFADVLRHVAFWNQYVAASARGENPDGSSNELPADKFSTKEKIVTALQRSIADASIALKKREEESAELVIPFLIHSGEHYGQLAVYYRLNGLVPPASR
jgi:hypothetical protein